MTFEFAAAGRVIFGMGTFSQVPPAAAAWGRRSALVTGSRDEPGAGQARASSQAEFQ